MANKIADGFATYGIGTVKGSSISTIGNNMLAGIYAEVDTQGTPNVVLATLPWDPTNTDVYLGDAIANGINLSSANGIRRVFPAAYATAIVSCYFALAELPATYCDIYALADASNNAIIWLRVTSTGAIQVLDNDRSTVLAATSGPVLVAQTATHIELKTTPATGATYLYVDGVAVISLASLSFTVTADAAQIRLLPRIGASAAGSTYTSMRYLGNLIIRDTSGSFNNDIVGDRRVATLFASTDDVAHQGWTAQHIERFGTGVLDLPLGTSSAVLTNSSSLGRLGSGDYTIEGQFRFADLPATTDEYTLASMWDTNGDNRSYRLFYGGPTHAVAPNQLCLEISTDGTYSAPVVVFAWPWQPIVGHHYHVAVSRTTGTTQLFIDGIEQGTGFADANTYDAATAKFALGASLASGAVVSTSRFQGWMDEFRLTIGVGRYTANFTPPSAAFPRSVGAGDADFASVALLCGFEGSITDESGGAGTLNALGSAAAITPGDGDYNYEVMAKATPDDDSFLEAALVAATGTLTPTANPSASETVTVGTTDGSTAAVYTFVSSLTTAYDVLIGATLTDTMNNLAAAINHATGEGSTYGTGTVANYDVGATVLPSDQLLVEAYVGGTGGNSIASTETMAAASWGGATLSGGLNIPSYSQFNWSTLPPKTTIVDSITFGSRSWKSDAGTATEQLSMVGVAAGVVNGGANPLTTVPTVRFDTFEEDPDSPGSPLTPTAILGSKVRVDRTA